ncbi:MAG: hypothetical protein FD143_3549 [Ignavibacteria bacterium]|nr:MAG: hypothetical protein FD143_3549 [Ignavibacteria bacterium]KAF0149012.1 MAG: hypothetical protein FD188_3500 [Ignavibacteria bacterium]
MARFNPSFLGSPSGKLGKSVFRQINGKTFVSNRPDTYNISQSKYAKNSRQAFAIIVQFAKLITSSPQLAYCWQKAKIKGTSAYHRVIKHNLPLTADGLLSVRNIIIPKGFDCVLKSELTADLYYLGNLNLLESEVKAGNSLNAYFIFALSNPEANQLNMEFLTNITSFDQIQDTRNIEFNINFNQSEKKLIYKYKKMFVFSAFIISGENKVLNSSSSLAKEFLINKD